MNPNNYNHRAKWTECLYALDTLLLAAVEAGVCVGIQEAFLLVKRCGCSLLWKILNKSEGRKCQIQGH